MHHLKRVSARTVNWWHQLLASYFSYGPTARLEQMSTVGTGFWGLSADVVEAWSILVPQYAREEWVQRYVEDLVAEFEAMFSECSD